MARENNDETCKENYYNDGKQDELPSLTQKEPQIFHIRTIPANRLFDNHPSQPEGHRASISTHDSSHTGSRPSTTSKE